MNWPKRKWLDDEVEQAVLDVIHYYRERGDDLPSQAHFEELYCKNFVQYQGLKGYADAVNSGTSAVYIAIAALGIAEGDQVITSPVTDFGTISAMALHKLKILVADSREGNFNTSLQEVQHVHTPLVNGIIVTHSAGDPISDIEEIADFCHEQGIWLIEDCSQAHGAMVANRKVGTFGDIAIFSTMHSKNHSTGGTGGILYTQSQEIYHKIRSYADRGKLFHQEGFNSKDPECIGLPALNHSSNELSCAIGNVTLGRLDQIIIRRRNFLLSLREKIRAAGLPLEIKMNIKKASPYFCPIEITDPIINIPRLKEMLRLLEFPCNSHYSFVVSEWDWSKEFLVKLTSTPHATQFRNHSFNLLFNENFGLAEEDKIIELLKEAFSNVT